MERIRLSDFRHTLYSFARYFLFFAHTIAHFTRRFGYRRFVCLGILSAGDLARRNHPRIQRGAMLYRWPFYAQRAHSPAGPFAVYAKSKHPGIGSVSYVLPAY